MAFAYAVALTGGIGTGKSTACSMLKLLGFRVIDADAITHELLDMHADTIAAMFGSAYVSAGRVNRKELGKLVFSEKEQKQKLEAFIHPLIYERIKNESEKLDAFAKPYLIDIPLFFEKNSYPIDVSVVVYTPQHLQRTRLMQREGLSLQQAQKKMDLQMDIEQKKQRGDFVIDNSGDLAHLHRECEQFKKDILGYFERK
ncbi:MAG: dephospho-CoA kinase [Campylobacterota bacterium]